MSRPFKGAFCSPHKNAGVAPGDALFFAPECPKCQELMAAGKRTGREPHPNTRPKGPTPAQKRRMSAINHEAILARERQRVILPLRKEWARG